MMILAGLGNPGSKYQNHRHNVGFMAAEAILRRHAFPAPKKRFQALVSEGRLGTTKCLIMMPQTYMNESGRAVGEAMRFYKLAPENVTVLYDELDLAAGKLRVRTGGGAAGHNGIRSIANHIGPDFNRVRIGIGHPGDKARVHGHVLGDFSKADQDWLPSLIDAIADYADLLAGGDQPGFMNKVSLATK
ncbi:MAG: aminoacyl-tRNA hydrolase [Alphaproteobacteria bacterium]